jgi:3-oxoacyl-[acyl-carrier-protein] synthase III
MIRSGRITRGLVTASEVENNPHPQDQRGVAELGSAIALQRCDDVNLGFAEFFFQSYPEFADKLSASTRFRDGNLALIVNRADDLEQILIDCVHDCVSRFLKELRVEIGRYDRIVLCLPASVDQSALATLLGVSAGRISVPEISDRDGDAFTSGLAALWNDLTHSGPIRSGTRWLLVSAGAGIEVACVEYQF